MGLLKGPKIKMPLVADGELLVGRMHLSEETPPGGSHLPPQFFTSSRRSWAKEVASCSASCRQPTFLPVA